MSAFLITITKDIDRHMYVGFGSQVDNVCVQLEQLWVTENEVECVFILIIDR